MMLGIGTVNAVAKEHNGYPTQKPLFLLERIIKGTKTMQEAKAQFHKETGRAIKPRL